MGIYFGAFAAILIGAEAGTIDLVSGVFRDLAATGRSQTVLFLARVPAAIAIALTLTLSGFAVTVAAGCAFHGSAPAPQQALSSSSPPGSRWPPRCRQRSRSASRR